MLSKSLILLNIVLALGGLTFGIQLAENFETKQVNVPKLKVNFHKFQFQEESFQLSFSTAPEYREKTIQKKQVATVAKKPQIKQEIVQEVKYLASSKKEVVIDLIEKDEGEEENPAVLNNPILKVSGKPINNEELIKLGAYKPVTIHKENWVAFLDTKNIEKNLLALKDYYPEQQQFVNDEAMAVAENKPANTKEITDISKEKLSVTYKPKKGQSDELVFYDYSQPAEEIVEPIEEKIKVDDENLTKKNYIAPSVANVIKREMTGQQVVKLAQSAPVRPREERRKPQPVPPQPPPSIVNTTVIKAIEVNLNSRNIAAVSRFNFIPDYDQNMVYESDNYDSSLALDYNLSNDYSVIRGRLDSQGMLLTRVEIPLLTSHEQIEVPLFNQQTFFQYLESKEIQGYGGHLLVDLDETDIVDVDLIAINTNGYDSYERRVFLDENFKETTLEKGFRYSLFLNVNPGVVMVKYLNDKGAELQKPTFVLPDELLFEPTKLREYSNENITLNERGSLAKGGIPADIDSSDIIDFYSGNKINRESINEYSISRDIMFSNYRKYLELNHLESPIILGYGQVNNLEVPTLDYIQNIMSEMEITLERECLIQLNLKKDIADIQMYGEAVNGPLSYQERFLGDDGYFTNEINGNSEKLFLVGMEPGIISMKIEYADKSSEYFQTFCSEGSYLIEQL